MRLFFAVELPPDVQAALGRLRPRDDSRDYRWVDPGLLHVTLAFLGNQPPERLGLLETLGQAAASASQAASLRLGAAGSFGSRKAPRVLWVGLEGDLAALNALQAQLDSGLRTAGFDLEDRPFRPHITLARRRPMATGPAPPGWPPARIGSGAAWQMRHLTLFESRLSPRGPTYVPVSQFALTSI